MSRLGEVTFHLDGFDGPLGLLLELIERRELDITTVSLAQVADRYLAHVRAMQRVDADGLAEFVAVAAKLLLIKSIVLLPRPEKGPDPEEVVDPTDLVERLREYQAFKQAAAALKEREEAGLRSYGRVVPLLPPPSRPRPDTGAPLDLVRALQRLAGELARRMPEETVAREQFSIGEKIDLLRGRVRGGGTVSLLELLSGCGRAEMVATFLALLELLRLGEVDARQDERFGDVVVVPGRVGAIDPLAPAAL